MTASRPDRAAGRNAEPSRSAAARAPLRGLPAWLRRPLPWVLLLALLLRLPNLDESLWVDEYLSSLTHLSSFERLLRIVRIESTPPLHYFLMFFWGQLFGDSHVAMRMPSLIAGIGSVYLTWALGRRFAGERTATLAALLLAMSPVHIWYSQEARNYSLFVFFTLASVHQFEKLRASRGGIWQALGYGLACLGMLGSHFFGAIIAGVISIVSLIPRSTRKTVRNGVLAFHAALIVLPLPLLWRKREIFLNPTGQRHSTHLGDFTPVEWWQLFANWFPFGNVFGPAGLGAAATTALAVLQIAVLGVLVRGLLAFWREPGRRHVPAYLLATPLCFLALWALPLPLRSDLYIPRAFLNLLPFFCLCLARGVESFGRPPPRAGVRPGPFALAVALQTIVVGTYFARADAFTVYKPNPDWEGVARFLADDTPEGLRHPVFVRVPHPLRYYIDGPIRNADQVPTILATLADMREKFPNDPLFRSYFYILDNRYWNHVPEEVLREQLARHHAAIVESHHFKGVDAYKVYEREASSALR